jgi:hypothetical protein
MHARFVGERVVREVEIDALVLGQRQRRRDCAERAVADAVVCEVERAVAPNDQAARRKMQHVARFEVLQQHLTGGRYTQVRMLWPTTTTALHCRQGMRRGAVRT